MIRLMGLSGSARKGSYNTALLRAASEMVPEGVDLSVHTIRGVPVYDGDLEKESGIPESVTTLKDAAAEADGLVLVTPEYNNSLPGAFKNTIDWMTRPPKDAERVFAGKPVLLIGASPGGFGTILSQNAWLPVLRTMKTMPWTGGKLMVSRAGKVFDEDGRITDEAVEKQLSDTLSAYVDFVKSVTDAR